MLDFEDRAPAPPLSWPARVGVAILAVLSVAGLLSVLYALGSLLISIF